jgi:hypothetical protein
MKQTRTTPWRSKWILFWVGLGFIGGVVVSFKWLGNQVKAQVWLEKAKYLGVAEQFSNPLVWEGPQGMDLSVRWADLSVQTREDLFTLSQEYQDRVQRVILNSLETRTSQVLQQAQVAGRSQVHWPRFIQRPVSSEMIKLLPLVAKPAGIANLLLNDDSCLDFAVWVDSLDCVEYCAEEAQKAAQKLGEKVCLYHAMHPTGLDAQHPILKGLQCEWQVSPGMYLERVTDVKHALLSKLKKMELSDKQKKSLEPDCELSAQSVENLNFQAHWLNQVGLIREQTFFYRNQWIPNTTPWDWLDFLRDSF